MSASKPITTAAVTAYAAELRRKAEKVTNPDPANQDYSPFYKPYAPTEEVAWQLVSRKRKELVEALGPHATADQIAAARAEGPAAALREMKFIARQRERTFQADLEAERHRTNRHVNQIRSVQRTIDRARSGMTPGQRIDDALGKLAIIASGTTASLAEKVTTGETDTQAPPFVGDPAAKAREIATKAARDIEEELDKARRRRVEKIAA